MRTTPGKSPVENSQGSPLQWITLSLHWLFAAIAVPLVVFLAVRTPAFQTPDEFNHFRRSCQVAQGVFFGGSGGYVDSALDQLYVFIAKLPNHYQEHVTEADRAGARAVRWSGQLVYREFANTAAYFPANYLPQAGAILAGQALHLSVLQTLILARLLNGMIAIAICTFALSLCGRGKVVLFALLLFPMPLSLFASSSQDATLIAFACLALSLISRQLTAAAPMSQATAILVSILLFLLALARPPLAALTLVYWIPGLLPARSRARERLTALALIGVTVTATLAWWIAVTVATQGVSRPFSAINNTDPKLQLIYLLHHPAIVFPLLGWLAGHAGYYLAGIIGVLGWLDVWMPAPYYLAMLLVMVVAVFAELTHGPALPRLASVLICLASFIGVAGTFFLLYLLDSPIGDINLGGAQGRHILPLLVAAAVGVPCWEDSRKFHERATALVVLAQLCTVIVLPHVLLARYYGG
jgi:uncharacterized membrane protein